MLRFAAVLLFVVPSPLIAEAQEPPKLQPVFSDDFSKDTRSDYTIEGDVSWEQGKLTLAEGASIDRAINGGAWAKVELALDLPKLSKEQPQSELRVWFILEGATNCYVRLRRELQEGGTVSSVALVDTGEKDGKAIEEVVRTTVVKESDFKGLSVECRQGLVSAAVGDAIVMLAHIDNGSATVAATRAEAVTSTITLTMLAASALNEETREYSEDQKRQLVDAMKANSELIVLYRAGKFADATKVGEKVLQIRKAVLGERHPDYASSLGNLAMLYMSMGDFARAEPLYLQAIEIKKSALGEKHPTYATSLNNLAALYYQMSDYARAEPLYMQALEIKKDAVGEKHPDYANSLNNLAALYHRRGDYARAGPLYKQALEIRKSVLGEKHPDYAGSLHNLAGLYKSKGDYALAEPLLKQAMDIKKSVLGEKHPSYAISLKNLARLYIRMGDYLPLTDNTSLSVAPLVAPNSVQSRQSQSSGDHWDDKSRRNNKQERPGESLDSRAFDEVELKRLELSTSALRMWILNPCHHNATLILSHALR